MTRAAEFPGLDGNPSDDASVVTSKEYTRGHIHANRRL